MNRVDNIGFFDSFVHSFLIAVWVGPDQHCRMPRCFFGICPSDIQVSKMDFPQITICKSFFLNSYCLMTRFLLTLYSAYFFAQIQTFLRRTSLPGHFLKLFWQNLLWSVCGCLLCGYCSSIIGEGIFDFNGTVANNGRN